MNDELCVCGSNKQALSCCLPYLDLEQDCETPEQMMRSRYSAFALGNVDYLLYTSSESLKEQLTITDLQQTIDSFEFINLNVLNSSENKVEFCADLLLANEHHQLKEKSTFFKENGRWKYDSGILEEMPVIKLKRNDLCPCGSGLKFKKCHQTN